MNGWLCMNREELNVRQEFGGQTEETCAKVVDIVSIMGETLAVIV